jgi:hypothetical protein
MLQSHHITKMKLFISLNINDIENVSNSRSIVDLNGFDMKILCAFLESIRTKYPANRNLIFSCHHSC